MFGLLASDEALEAFAEHREIFIEQLEESQGGWQAVISTEAALEKGIGSDQENRSDGSSNDKTAFDNDGHVKIGAKAALAGINYDFGKSWVTKAHIASLDSVAHYFLKGYGWAPGAESIPDPLDNEAVVFKDFFAAGLCMPPHPVILDIWCKFWVQLHQLTPNAIVQISKFIWTVTSYGGHPTISIFAHHYDLHYQNKKIHLEGPDTTFATQFGCISFHPSGWEIGWGLPPPWGISGWVAEMVTGSIVGCLWSKKSMFKAKEATCWAQWWLIWTIW
jgi:hypothetical protein